MAVAIESSDKNILELCRLCLSDTHLVSFRSKEVTDRDLLRKIWLNFRFHIVAVPGSPVPHVCKICIGLVEAFYIYFTQCIENQSYYENLIDNWEKAEFYKYGKGTVERTKEARKAAADAVAAIRAAGNGAQVSKLHDIPLMINNGKQKVVKGDGTTIENNVVKNRRRRRKRKKLPTVPVPPVSPLPMQVKPSEFCKKLKILNDHPPVSSPVLTPKSFYRVPKPSVPYIRSIENDENIKMEITETTTTTTTTTNEQILTTVDATNETKENENLTNKVKSLIDEQPSTSASALLLLNQAKIEQISKSSHLSKYYPLIKDALKPIPKRLTFPSDAKFLPPAPTLMAIVGGGDDITNEEPVASTTLSFGGDGSAFYNYAEKKQLMGDDLDVIAINLITFKREPVDMLTDADGNEILSERQKRKLATKKRRRENVIYADIRPDTPKTALRKKLDQLMPESLHVKTDRYSNDERIKRFYQLTCPICPEDAPERQIFETFKDILVHCDTVHKQPGYILCCGRKLFRKDRILTHMTLHENPDAFKCPDCGHKSQSKPLLRIHMKVHLPLHEGGLQKTEGKRKKRLGRPGISTSDSKFNIYPIATATEIKTEPIETKQEAENLSQIEIKSEVMDYEEQYQPPPLLLPIKQENEFFGNIPPSLPYGLQQEPLATVPSISQPLVIKQELLMENERDLSNLIIIPSQPPPLPAVVQQPATIKLEPMDTNNCIENSQQHYVQQQESIPNPPVPVVKQRKKRTTKPKQTEESTPAPPIKLETVETQKKKGRKPSSYIEKIEVGEFYCHRCDAKFEMKTQLQSHLVSVHNLDKDNPYECNECKQLFPDVTVLRDHESEVHKKILSHICSSCNKEFKMYRALYAHIRNVHLQVKNFPCNLCEKRFRRRLELAEHLARHSGEVLYKCLYCSQTFGARTNYLNHHRKRHPNEQIADLLSILDNSTSMAADITMILEESASANTRRNKTTKLPNTNTNNAYNSNNDPTTSSSSYHVTGDDDMDNGGGGGGAVGGGGGSGSSENNFNNSRDGAYEKITPNFSSTPKLMMPNDLRKNVTCTIVSGENNKPPTTSSPMMTSKIKINSNQNDIDVDDIETQIHTHVVGDMPQTFRMKLDDEINSATTNNAEKFENNVNGNINAA